MAMTENEKLSISSKFDDVLTKINNIQQTQIKIMEAIERHTTGFQILSAFVVEQLSPLTGKPVTQLKEELQSKIK